MLPVEEAVLVARGPLRHPLCPGQGTVQGHHANRRRGQAVRPDAQRHVVEVLRGHAVVDERLRQRQANAGRAGQGQPRRQKRPRHVMAARHHVPARAQIRRRQVNGHRWGRTEGAVGQRLGHPGLQRQGHGKADSRRHRGCRGTERRRRRDRRGAQHR